MNARPDRRSTTGAPAPSVESRDGEQGEAGPSAREKAPPSLSYVWTAAAVRTLRLQAEQGNVEALSQLGGPCLEGLRTRGGGVLIRRDVRAGCRFLERGVALGDTGAMLELANHLDERATSTADWSRAIALYRQAFRRGEATAAYNLASTYKKRGRYREAVAWWRRAHDAGDPSAILDIALAELHGHGTHRNVRGALAKLRQAANATEPTWFPRSSGENVRAMIHLARVYGDGWLVPRDLAESVRWLRLAAAWDSAIAKAMLVENWE